MLVPAGVVIELLRNIIAASTAGLSGGKLSLLFSFFMLDKERRPTSIYQSSCFHAEE